MELSPLTNQLIRYEEGELSEEETIEFFQSLVDSTLLPYLQGSYSRTALALLRAGLIVDKRGDGEQDKR